MVMLLTLLLRRQRADVLGPCFLLYSSYKHSFEQCKMSGDILPISMLVWVIGNCVERD